MSITANPFNHVGLDGLLMMEWGRRAPQHILAKQSVVGKQLKTFKPYLAGVFPAAEALVEALIAGFMPAP